MLGRSIIVHCLFIWIASAMDKASGKPSKKLNQKSPLAFKGFKVYFYFRILSLDIVFGAGAMLYFFAYSQAVYPSFYYYFSLGMAVWLIYTLDHLLDAYRIPHVAHTPRHRFHQKYFYPLGAIWGVGFIAALLATFHYLSPNTLYYGIGVSLLVALHFALGLVEQLQNALFFQKETRIALVYTLGVSVAPFSLGGFVLDTQWLLLGGQVFLLALVNLLIISWYELESDEQDQHVSMVRSLGKKKIKKIMQGLLVGQATLALLSIFILDERGKIASFILILMMLTLYWVQEQSN